MNKRFNAIFIVICVSLILCVAFTLNKIKYATSNQVREDCLSVQIDPSFQSSDNVYSRSLGKREIKHDAMAAEQKSREQFLQNIKSRRMAQQETIIAGPVLSPDVSGGGYKASDGSFVFSSSSPSNVAETETFSFEADQSTAKPLTFEEELARFRATVPAIKPAHQTAVCLLQ